MKYLLRAQLLLIALIILFSITGLPSAQAQSSDVSLYLQTPALSVSPGSSLPVAVKLDTGSDSFRAVQADITYPAELLTVENIDVSSSVFGMEVLNTAANGNISIVRGSLNPITGQGLLVATINFKTKTTGIAALDFAPSSAVVNSPVDSLTSSPGLVLTIVPSATPVPTPTPTPTPSSTPKPTPTPAPSATPSAQSTIKIYAAGSAVKNIFPTIKLDIKDSKTGAWNNVKSFADVKGDINSRNFQEFVYTHKTKVPSQNIRVRFVNDSYAPQINQDRNVLIDRINIDGIDIQTERATTYSQGSWSETGCKAGIKKSEWLHCNGFFEYR